MEFGLINLDANNLLNNMDILNGGLNINFFGDNNVNATSSDTSTSTDSGIEN
jgi:hypothetical protein